MMEFNNEQLQEIATAARLGAHRIEQRLANTDAFSEFKEFDTDQLDLLEARIRDAIKYVLTPVPIPR